jgi:hypothetical protein
MAAKKKNAKRADDVSLELVAMLDKIIATCSAIENVAESGWY